MQLFKLQAIKAYFNYEIVIQFFALKFIAMIQVKVPNFTIVATN